MVRYCAMMSCANTDKHTLCHRFPKREPQFKRWQEAADKMHMADQELYERYVVCTMHFDQSDYKHEQSRALNTTAVPKQSLHWKAPLYHAPTAVHKSAAGTENNASCLYSQATVETLGPEEKLLALEAPLEGQPAVIQMLQIEHVQEAEKPGEKQVTDEQSESSNSSDDGEEQEYDDTSDDTEPNQYAPASEEVVMPVQSQNCLQMLPSTYPPGPITIVIDGFQNYGANTATASVPNPNPAAVTAPPNFTTIVDASTQTTLDEDALQEQIIEEFYPTYSGRSRLTLIKQIVNTQKELLTALTTIRELSTTLAQQS